MRTVVVMDASGLNALEDLYEKFRRKGKYLILSAPHTQPLLVMDKGGFLDRIGRENVCAHLDAALARAREILQNGSAPAHSAVTPGNQPQEGAGVSGPRP